MSRPPVQARRKNPVGAPPPEKWWGRLARHRFAIRVPVGDVIDDSKAVGLHYTATSWYRLPRWCWRHRDSAITPCLPVIVLFPLLGWLFAILPFPAAPRFVEWAAAGAASLAVGLAVGFAPSFVEAPIVERRVRAMQKELTARINGLTVEAVQVRDHATTVVATVAQGLDPDDYDRQKSTLASSFRSPLHITKDTPGRLELRLEHEDLLATPAEWQPVADLHPAHIPVGHDWDGDPFPFALAHQSLLVAGIRGGGKSAFLNGLIARLVAMPNVELYLIDPLEGVDLGIWWRAAEEVADSEERGVKLLGHFEDLRAERVRRMVNGPHPVQIARYGQRWPMRVLVVDELASVALWGTRTQQTDTANLLHSIVAKGRKSNDVVIAATQHPSAAVLPTLVRGQFVHVLGLRVGRREQTRQVFGDGVVGDWDLSKIPADQPGRGIWSDGSRMTPIRSSGLWGQHLRKVAADLAQGRNFDPEPPAESAGTVEMDGGLAFSAGGPEEPESLDSADRIRQALPIDGEGVSAAWIVQQTGLSQSTVYDHLGRQLWVVKVRHGRYRRRP